jgi:hypothetical protein
MQGFSAKLRDARRDQRYPVLFPAQLLIGTVRQAVMVRDLSKNGVMLSAKGLPPLGTKVLVTLGAARMFGTIAWTQDEYSGVVLREPIEPLQIVRDMTRPRASTSVRASAPKPYGVAA